LGLIAIPEATFSLWDGSEPLPDSYLSSLSCDVEILLYKTAENITLLEF